MPWVVHWGLPLPDDEDIVALTKAQALDVTGGGMDRNAPLSICPKAALSFPGHPALEARRDGVRLLPRFLLKDAEATDTGLQFDLRADEMTYRAFFSAIPLGDDKAMLVAEATLQADEPIDLIWFAAPVLPGPQQADDMIDYAGRWLGEFRPVRTPWSPGQRVREAQLGRSGHEHPPFAVFPERGTTKTHGTAYAAHLAWSGGHRMIAEELADGRRQVQWGKLPGSGINGTEFASGRVLHTLSDQGMNGCAVAFQRYLRGPGLDGPRRTPRPVHYNCWEAIYFNHSLPVLKDIADRAARLGTERFVLDDGWFGRRDDDTTSLGDWDIDPRKWPDGLGPLIEHVTSLGMVFGLWVEPEMVSPDSNLYRAHPDWILGRHDQPLGRQQLVLDLGRPEVQDHLFQVIDTLLSNHDIDYLKWDHNRMPPMASQKATAGVYALLDRLNAAHPAVEIESCASGGGRIDAEILRYCGRVWMSDSNDALERLRIQHDAAQFLPAAITGSHVGPRKCHTSGRVLPTAFRAWVAAQRHFGFELDPRGLDDAEMATLARVTQWWKANRDWMMQADIHLLDAIDKDVTAELQLSQTGDRFVVFAGQSGVSNQALPRPLRLAGLDPTARYDLRLANPEDIPPHSRGPVLLRDGAVALSGAALQQNGLNLPWGWPATMWVIEGRRL